MNMYRHCVVDLDTREVYYCRTKKIATRVLRKCRAISDMFCETCSNVSLFGVDVYERDYLRFYNDYTRINVDM